MTQGVVKFRSQVTSGKVLEAVPEEVIEEEEKTIYPCLSVWKTNQKLPEGRKGRLNVRRFGSSEEDHNHCLV